MISCVWTEEKEGVGEMRNCKYDDVPQIFSFLFIFLMVVAEGTVALTRDDFPPGFIFGAGSSAYQVEGAAAEDGKKPSIWDTHTHEGHMADKSNADITVDQYHKYKEDVKLMHEIGLDAYRMSISWPRLIPDGRGVINLKGLDYYNNLIDELVNYGIQPHVTLYHFDLPQALEDEYNGKLSPRFIEDFTTFANVCFKKFGDRVKHWITLNEPNIEAIGGYDTAMFPPLRCSYPFGSNCTKGDSTTEPYLVAHHLLLAHASAVSLYKEKYQAKQGGQIGITFLGWWHEPATQSPDDIAAAKRMNDFHIGWFMHPMVYGDYPPVMRRNVGSRLPSLTTEESKKVQGSFDFVGFNHYFVAYVKADLTKLNQKVRDYYSDAGVEFEPPSASIKAQSQLKAGLFPSDPSGLSKMLEYIKLNYKNPPIMIHENGAADIPDPAGRYVYDDDFRSQYMQDYMESLLQSIRNGSDTLGYFVWSFLDCFEFLFGYSVRFGLYGVDFTVRERTRYARHSANWYSNFLHGSEVRGIESDKSSAA